MRKLAVVVGLVLLSFAVTGVASAARTQQVTFDISDSFTDEFLSDQCGVEVVVTTSGYVKATVRYNRAGLVVSETDRQPSSRITYSSPDTGRSFSFPNAVPSHWDYGDGAMIGSPAGSTWTGGWSGFGAESCAKAGAAASRQAAKKQVRIIRGGLPQW